MAKAKKIKIPKRIAGIKVPKTLRKSGGSLAGLLQTPHGREIAAAALSAAAAALLGTNKAREVAGDAGSAAVGAGLTIAGGLESAGHAAGTVLREAAHSILPASVVDDDARAEIESASSKGKADVPKKQRGSALVDRPSKH